MSNGRCGEPRCCNWGSRYEDVHKHILVRPKHGKTTCLLDCGGETVYEGDILTEYYNEYYGDVRVVVKWATEKGAWISKGEFHHGGGHESLNGEHFKELKKIGNIDKNRDLYFPAKNLMEATNG